MTTPSVSSISSHLNHHMIRRMMFAMGLFVLSPTNAADLEAGKALVKSKGCVECHGLSGNKGNETAPPVPKLAGQPKTYLIKVMKEYRSGTRQDETMNVLMSPRTDADIELLAEYYSAQKRY